MPCCQLRLTRQTTNDRYSHVFYLMIEVNQFRIKLHVIRKGIVRFIDHLKEQTQILPKGTLPRFDRFVKSI